MFDSPTHFLSFLLARNNFDDTEESIANRLSTFNETTKPVLEKYKDKVRKLPAKKFIIS